MAISYFPFDAGAGANVTEDQWRKMARHWLGTGVLSGEDDELAVSESGTPAMSVDVAAGKAWLRGHYMESDAVETKAIGAADPTDDRIDRVVLRADFTANTVSIEVLEGTPAASPTAPALTQSSAAWEVSLAQVFVQAAASSILDADITDERDIVASGGSSGIVELYDEVLSAAGSFDVPSLPQNYKALRIVLTARGDTAASSIDVRARFNGDSGAKYASQYVRGVAAVASASEAASATSAVVGHVAAASATAGHCGVYEIVIPGYALTTFFKNWKADGGWTQALTTSTMAAQVLAGVYADTDAIESLAVFPSAGDFIAGSRLTVYGIQ